MPGRVYVSPLTGDGTEENPYRGLICTLQYVVRCRSAIATQPTGENRGRPSQGWTIVYVETRNPATGLEDWSAVDANSQVILVRFDESLDDPISSVVRNRIRQSGALTTEQLATITTYREALLAILREQYPDATLESQFPEMFV